MRDDSDGDTRIDVQQALRVWQKIREKGERDGHGHTWRGVYAESDFDGYNVTLAADGVTLRVSFHSRFSIDCRHRRSLVRFVQRLADIDAA